MSITPPAVDGAEPLSWLTTPGNSPGSPVDPSTDMTPLAQPAGPTATQVLVEEYPDFRMYKETAVIEL